MLAKAQGADGAPVQALADKAVDQAKGKASDKIGTFAGSDFEAGSVKQGADNFKAFVGAVDFPKFVGGLVQNVFQAIVDASIQPVSYTHLDVYKRQQPILVTMKPTISAAMGSRMG